MRKEIFSPEKSFRAAKRRSGWGLVRIADSSAVIVYISPLRLLAVLSVDGLLDAFELDCIVSAPMELPLFLHSHSAMMLRVSDCRRLCLTTW